MGKTSKDFQKRDSYILIIFVSIIGFFALLVPLVSLNSLRLIDWLLDNFGYANVSEYLRFFKYLYYGGLGLTLVSIFAIAMHRYGFQLRRIKLLVNIWLSIVLVFMLGSFMVGSLVNWTSFVLRKRDNRCTNSVITKDPYQASLGNCTVSDNDVRRVVLLGEFKNILALAGLLSNALIAAYFIELSKNNLKNG